MTGETSEEYFRRLVDVDALRVYLAEHLGPADELSVERHQAGHSNETLFVSWGARELVIRRPPPGETAETAHDVLREYRVVEALQETAVPVPTTVLACDDHDVIGSDFYLMERLEGDVIREVEPDRFASPAARQRLGRELIDTLALIHGVDYETVGLSEFGHPDGFTQRQVDRWGQQLDWAFERTEEVRPVPELADVGEWLDIHLPEEYPHTLVHGDYKLDNVMFGPEQAPELVGVFDWELSTLGDPFTDLGWLLLFWHDAGDPPSPIPELQSTFMERDGYPTRRELVERYEARTGWPFEHERFYRVLGVYKLAGLGEMFFRRYLEGNSDDPMYPAMETRVPALAEEAVRLIEADEPV